MPGLTSAEKHFCRAFAETRDTRAAAVLAGIEDWESAGSLFDKAQIRSEIARCEKLRAVRRAELQAGIRRLAFGSITDAVRLLLSDEPPTLQELERMDLFNVSDIKRPKGGGLEIKFFDRIKALELLAQHTSGDDDAMGELIKALKK
ncbi:MAG: terminase small subunit [Clostridium sp.]|nr:terminase small subunit [Clostridium sp.]